MVVSSTLVVLVGRPCPYYHMRTYSEITDLSDPSHPHCDVAIIIILLAISDLDSVLGFIDTDVIRILDRNDSKLSNAIFRFQKYNFLAVMMAYYTR